MAPFPVLSLCSLFLKLPLSSPWVFISVILFLFFFIQLTSLSSMSLFGWLTLLFFLSFYSFAVDHRSLLVKVSSFSVSLTSIAIFHNSPNFGAWKLICWVFLYAIKFQLLTDRSSSVIVKLRMGDHFVLLVDRLLTESTLEAAIGSRNQAKVGSPDSASIVDLETDLRPKKNAGDGISAEKLVQCRICHDEDEDSNMEIPCTCSGSLKVNGIQPGICCSCYKGFLFWFDLWTSA